MEGSQRRLPFFLRASPKPLGPSQRLAAEQFSGRCRATRARGVIFAFSVRRFSLPDPARMRMNWAAGRPATAMGIARTALADHATVLPPPSINLLRRMSALPLNLSQNYFVSLRTRKSRRGRE